MGFCIWEGCFNFDEYILLVVASHQTYVFMFCPASSLSVVNALIQNMFFVGIPWVTLQMGVMHDFSRLIRLCSKICLQ